MFGWRGCTPLPLCKYLRSLSDQLLNFGTYISAYLRDPQMPRVCLGTPWSIWPNGPNKSGKIEIAPISLKICISQFWGVKFNGNIYFLTKITFSTLKHDFSFQGPKVKKQGWSVKYTLVM